jgi:protein SCO1/2
MSRGVLARPLGLAVALVLASAGPVAAHEPAAILREVGVDQKIGERLPGDVTLRDDQGRAVILSALVADRPAVLVFVQYACPNLCALTLDALASAVIGTGLRAGEGYGVLIVSLDPREGSADAAHRKAELLRGALRAREAHGWHFLTGDAGAIRRLAESTGIRYAYDESSDQFAHPAAATILTGTGHVSRYLFGLDFPPRDLRLALVEASDGTLGAITDTVLLACYRYDATAGRYTPVIMNVVRVAGVLTAAGLGLMLALLLRGERVRARARGPVGREPHDAEQDR